jgi:hypothetical protein
MLNEITQSIAEPLLWDTLVIREERRLISLQTQLRENTYIHGKNTGRMIRTLDMRVFVIGAKISESVHMIILMTSRLRCYRNTGCFMGLPELMTLSNTAAVSLTHLELLIESGPDGIFPVMNSFVNLHSLVMDVDGDDWRHSRAHPLKIHSLKHLSWCSESSDTNMLAFLSQSSLAPDAQVKLQIFEVFGASATLLKPFFARNTIRELELNMETDLVCALMPEIMQCSEVILNTIVPPFASQDTANMAYPRKLTIKGIEDEDLFWNELGALVSLPPLVGKTMTLSISYTSKPDIDWLDLAADNAGFVARLLHHAVILYRRGIIVVDKHDRDVSSFTKI